MKRVAEKVVDDDKNNQSKKPRCSKSCISCSGVASFTLDYCPNGCTYDVCIDCTFGFTEFVNGCDFKKIRIKCMVCREALPVDDIEYILHKLLSRRKRFYTVIEDKITEDRYVLAKDQGQVSLAPITQMINRNKVIIRKNPSQLFPPPPPPPAPIFQTYTTTTASSSPQYVPPDLTSLLAMLQTPVYTPTNREAVAANLTITAVPDSE